MNYVDFGRYLRAEREQRKVSLEDVARSTKISPTLIEALEEGQAERFPERVFMLNYVRSYAAAVGLSGDDAVARYEGIPEAPRAETFDPSALEVVRQHRALTVMWGVVAALTIGVFGLVLDAMYDLALRFTSR